MSTLFANVKSAYVLTGHSERQAPSKSFLLGLSSIGTQFADSTRRWTLCSSRRGSCSPPGSTLVRSAALASTGCGEQFTTRTLQAMRHNCRLLRLSWGFLRAHPLSVSLARTWFTLSRPEPSSDPPSRPGTGKTVTIVEAIRQLLRQNPTARILACAPSNSAADLIAEKLVGVLSPDELFRFYAPSRQKEATSSMLKDHTYQSQGTYSVPLMSRMTRFKVIVSTCVSASVFHGIGMLRGHFGYIFVDEAGQATEPEVMIGVKTMADSSTRVILSGDHKQLGPIIRSDIARKLELETSYLERLMSRDGYEEAANFGIRFLNSTRISRTIRSLFRSSVVKLVKNFRSHEAILKFPNESFYRGDLQASAPRKVIDSFINRPILPNRRFPILFHGIVGKDDREASSPSFFNIDEVTQVKDYVMKLKEKYRISSFSSVLVIYRLLIRYHSGPRNWYGNDHFASRVMSNCYQVSSPRTTPRSRKSAAPSGRLQMKSRSGVLRNSRVR
jgi:hypothetical protein